MQLGIPPESTPDQEHLVQRLRVFRQIAVSGLLALSLLILWFALYLISASVQNDIVRSEANLAAAETQIQRLQTPAPAVLTALATVTHTVALADNLATARPPAGTNWPAVVAMLNQYNPAALTLTALVQVDQRLTLTGQAANDGSVVDYVHTLEQTTLFSDVVLESIVLQTPTPAPTQVATTPTAGTVTAVNFVITLQLSEVTQ